MYSAVSLQIQLIKLYLSVCNKITFKSNKKCYLGNDSSSCYFSHTFIFLILAQYPHIDLLKFLEMLTILFSLSIFGSLQLISCMQQFVSTMNLF